MLGAQPANADAVAEGVAMPIDPDRVAGFANPLDVQGADPAALWHDGVCYLTGTTFTRMVSTDLVHWRPQGRYLDPAGTWVGGHPWAAELHRQGDSFYFLFCAPGKETKGRRYICVAKADSPADTFKPVAFPLWEDEDSWIDPNVYTHTDGTPYLYVTKDNVRVGKPSEIWAAPLTQSMDRLAGPLQKLLEVSQPWEHGVQEGMTVFRRKDTLYMTYSSYGYNDIRYSVGYATAESPLGPWTKAPENPVLMRTATMTGPGHNGVVASPDGSQLWCIYHSHRTTKPDGRRQINIDRIRFEPNPDGPDRLVVDGPTETVQPFPAGVRNPRIHWGKDTFADTELDRTRWVDVWNERPDRWSLRDGALELKVVSGDVHETRSDTANILLQYVPDSVPWTATVQLVLPDGMDSEQAFLTVWQDNDNYLVLKAAQLGKPTFEAATELGGRYTAWYAPNTIGKRVWLRIVHKNGGYRFFAGDGKGAWLQIGGTSHARLIDPKVGFGTGAPGKTNNVTVRVEAFDLQR
jgi:beta-xylosidase